MKAGFGLAFHRYDYFVTIYKLVVCHYEGIRHIILQFTDLRDVILFRHEYILAVKHIVCMYSVYIYAARNFI